MWLVVNQNDTKADLNGWVTINNNSGTTYKNAELKLVAGDVNRVQEQAQLAGQLGMTERKSAAAPQFKSKPSLNITSTRCNDRPR